MKQSNVSRLLLILVLAAALGCGSTSTNTATPDARGSSVLDVATMLSGHWKAEGSDLRLNISSIGQGPDIWSYNLFATATGQAGGRTVNERAMISLEWNGGNGLVSVIPRFDPAVTVLSDPSQVSPDELRASCTFPMAPIQTGYSGQTQGGEACVRAVQGAVGPWNIEVTRETLRIYSSGDQQLVFRRVA